MRPVIPTDRDRPSAPRADVTCANCKMPIEEGATLRDGKTYCCDGCADGGPCLC